MEDLTKLVKSASKLVGHLNSSSVASQELNKVQHDIMKLKHDYIPDTAFQPLSLIQYCQTRWNSIETMLRRLKVVKEAVTSVLATLL